MRPKSQKVCVADETTHTSPGGLYIPPTRREMDTAVPEGLRIGNDTMAADLLNVISGGELTTADRDHDEATQWAACVPRREAGGWELSTGDYTDSYRDLYADRYDNRVVWHRAARATVAELCGLVDMKSLPGESPLAKFRSLLQIVDDNDALRQKFVGPGNLLEDPDDAQEVQEEDEQEKMVPADGESGYDERVEQLFELDRDKIEKKDWPVMLAARHLRMLSRAFIARAKKYEPSYDGTQLIGRSVSFDEVEKLAEAEWALPSWYRGIRLATQNADAYERCVQTDKKQIIYMMIDMSGSMSGLKLKLAIGCLLRGLMGVASGDAELYCSVFRCRLADEVHVRDEKGAKAHMATALSWAASGNTAIQPCLLAAIERVQAIRAERKDLCRPELVIVTDAEDSTVNMGALACRGVKLHAIFTSEGGNGNNNVAPGFKPIMALARSTGGIGALLSPGTLGFKLGDF